MYDVIANTPEISHLVISFRGLDFYGEKIQALGTDVYTLNMQKNIFNVFKVAGILRKNKPDIVQGWMHLANLVGGVFARFAGVKKIIWSVYWSHLPGFKNNIIEKINARLSYSIPSVILCCAESAKKFRVMSGYCVDKLTVVYNGYDADKFTRDVEAGNRLRNMYNISSEYLVLGYIARVHPDKDHLNLLHAINELKHLPIKLFLVGDSTDSDPTITDYIKNNSLENTVILCGFQENLNEYISMFDVFVLSSRREGFPNVVNEAMLCCTPCIVTNAGDCEHIVGDTGLVVPVQDSSALANAILAMTKIDREQIKQLGVKARTRIKTNFSLEKMLCSYKDIYLSLLNNKQVHLDSYNKSRIE